VDLSDIPPAYDAALSRCKLETIVPVGLWVPVGAAGTPSSMAAMGFAGMARSYVKRNNP